VLVDRDVLAIGPCHADPARNEQLRQRFWRSMFRRNDWTWPGWTRMRWPVRGRVVLWTSQWLADRLFLWRAVERLAGSDVEIWLAEPDVRGVGTMGAGDLEVALDGARKLSARQITSLRLGWKAWVEGRLDEVVRRLDAPLRHVVIDCLPRIEGRKLRLSTRDETMLQPFASWQAPLTALRSNLGELMVFGDLVLLDRLRSWVTASALASRPATGKSDWSRAELKLTLRGQQLLEQIASSGEAPPMFLGGHEVYGSNFWTVTRSGELRRVSSRPATATPRAARPRLRGRRRS